MDNDAPTSIFYDNMNSFKLIRNHVTHFQTKHFDIHHYYVREKYEDKTIQVHHIP
jgi:hypothetical protein